MGFWMTYLTKLALLQHFVNTGIRVCLKIDLKTRLAPRLFVLTAAPFTVRLERQPPSHNKQQTISEAIQGVFD